MKNGLLLLLFLFSAGWVQGQRIYNLPNVQPNVADFENIFTLPLESDELSSSFVIWIKKSVPAHFHREHSEQVLVLAGEGIIQMSGQGYRIVPGDLINIPKGVAHSVSVTSQEPLKVLSIQSPRFDGKDRVNLGQ